jgi:hypothetical protein
MFQIVHGFALNAAHIEKCRVGRAAAKRAKRSPHATFLLTPDSSPTGVYDALLKPMGLVFGSHRPTATSSDQQDGTGPLRLAPPRISLHSTPSINALANGTTVARPYTSHHAMRIEALWCLYDRCDEDDRSSQASVANLGLCLWHG